MVGGYTSLLGTVVIIMQRKSSLNMVQEAFGSDMGSYSIQSIEQRRALVCSKSATWYSQTLRGGEGQGLVTESMEREKRIEKWSEEETRGRILQEGVSMLNRTKTRSIVDGVLV